LKDFVTKDDIEALKYLNNITSKKLDDGNVINSNKVIYFNLSF
jgi:hypothetical protein